MKIRVKCLLFVRFYVVKWGCESKLSCGKISYFLFFVDFLVFVFNVVVDGIVYSLFDE